MKKNMLMLMMLIAISSSTYSNTKYIYKNPNYRVPLTNEYVVTIEQGAYNDFLRVVDEKNRRDGVFSNYSNKATKKAQRLHDNVDLIPVAHYTDEYDSYIVKYPIKSPPTDSDVARSFHSIHSIAGGATDGITQEDLNKLSYTRSSYQKRFYFGNGNSINDIIFVNQSNFDNEVTKAKKDNNERYLVEGVYQTIGSRNNNIGASLDEKNTNLLDISMDEYKSKIEGKSRTDVAAFLKEKMEEKGVTGLIQKGDELYTKDSKNTEWKVLWTLEPVSLHDTLSGKFGDTIFTKIYTYKEFDTDSSTDSKGRLLYTKNNNIYLEDKVNYSNELSLKDDPSKNISDLIKEAKEKAERGETPSTPLEKYYSDKKTLSDADFNAKWVDPFKNGDFDRDLANMKREVDEAREKLVKVTKEKDDADSHKKAIEQDSDWNDTLKNDAFWWKYKNESEKNTYLANLSEKQKKLFLEYIRYSAIFREKDDEVDTLNSDIQYDIPGRYGFNQYSWNPNDKRWLDKVIKDSTIIRNLIGKDVEFRGRGRIDGTIDLGEGNNTITITEQFTGRYGTNIILGPYSKIKNVHTIFVGGQLGSDQGVSISGKSSLTMDIDPSIKNSEGNLVQHALKDSDPNIIFRSVSSTLNLNNRNQFQIELMASRIANDSTIDIGRKIDYEYYDVEKGKFDMKLSFVSDSIAHTLSDNKKFSKNGTSLIDVKVKDSIKRLTNEENEVYKSIKNAQKLGVLFPTLTTTNKRTTFTVLEDEKQENKVKSLVSYLKSKSSEELINDLSEFNLSEENKKEVISLVEKIKETSIKEYDKKNKKNKDDYDAFLNDKKSLNEKLKIVEGLKSEEDYKRLNLEGFGANLETLKISQLIDEGDYVLKTKMDSDLIKISNEISKINVNDLQNLKDKYTNLKFKDIFDKLNVVKTKLANLNDTNYPDEDDFRVAYQYFLDDLNDLQKATNEQLSYSPDKVNKEIEALDKKLLALSEKLKNPDKDLIDSLEYYSGNEGSDAYQKLKNLIYYTMREEEVLTELKNMLNQLSDRNIYSKLNKISKNEISTYTNIPFEVTHALTDKKHIARGGFISNRTVQDNFKGNIYTAYGLYEKTAESGTKYGFMIGGANTKYNEVYQRSLTTVATESDIKGVSAYVGGYFNKPIVNNLNWITGVGAQYGTYKVKREMRNNYQDLHSEGKVNTNALNTYSGLIMNYPIQEDVFIQLKALLAYTMVKQSKVNESGDLPLDISAKTYHYVDGEAGISFNKIFYGDNLRSSISAGAYGITGLAGYKNGDMDAKIDGSTSSFGIKGDRIKKDAVKINLDYNVQTDIGYNYGLEGTYISNSKENNVKIGIKAGYTF